ncbi:nucleoside 2-deoxyribosyltransferase domain-containing protein [Actinokineospora enzanensis]|uniref:nucleoside 2-deoxyribosyltransferase domain-containing protein n=1 Tax=Actinokineospora enzanensis TaxID=155975 RepID=UPI00146BF1EE|nr:nucleoside 2-deoxyribosyltransferase domain-containing protein [Actinokineospora enzanensis]
MTTRYVEAPTRFRPTADDPPAVLLLGGISDCPDWQATARGQLADETCVVINPRRSEFDVADPEGEQSQVRWEREHRDLAEPMVVLFWFPASPTLHQPIALLELGAELAKPPRKDRLVVIGADPGYLRHANLVAQCSPDHTVHQTLHDTIDAARRALRKLGKRQRRTFSRRVTYKLAIWDNHTNLPRTVTAHSSREEKATIQGLQHGTHLFTIRTSVCRIGRFRIRRRTCYGSPPTK